MDNISWGIIGCGNVTEVKSGPAFNLVANSKLHAVMRRDAVKAEDYARRHQVPKWYSNADELINDPLVNAIYIATPPAYHEEYTLAALAAGKHVYVEKPITLDAAAACRIAASAKNSSAKLSVAHYRRQQPMFLKIKELLSDHAIGDIRFVKMEFLQTKANDMIAPSESNWRMNPKLSGGGLFHDLAPHQLDLMIYFFGEVDKAQGISLSQDSIFGVDDLITGHMSFKSRIIFTGTWCFTVPEGEDKDIVEIVGKYGKISFPVFGSEISVTIDGHDEYFAFEPLIHVQQPMIASVTDYFLGKADNPCTIDD
ncbi:MAG: Gfo/Idh/MocA family oxidoreductase, partial [Chryseobacterium sp.]